VIGNYKRTKKSKMIIFILIISIVIIACFAYRYVGMLSHQMIGHNNVHTMETIKDLEGLIHIAQNDNNINVRLHASYVLGNIGDEKAIDALIDCLKNEYYDVRMGAAQNLGRTGNKRVIEPLISALQDKHASVRMYAAYSLGILGDKRAIEPLIPLLEDKTEYVRKAANEALEKININNSINRSREDR